MHINIALPTSIANGAVKGEEWEFEDIPTVGGKPVRNSIWSLPLRTYELPWPARQIADADIALIREVWRVTEAGVHTFNFFDEEDNETVRVQFEGGPLRKGHVEGPWHRFETIMLREFRG